MVEISYILRMKFCLKRQIELQIKSADLKIEKQIMPPGELLF